MKWKFILATSLFQTGKLSSAYPSINPSIPIKENFSEYNLTIDSLVTASPNFIEDMAFYPEVRIDQVKQVTDNVERDLQNTETFCKIAFSKKKSACDRSGNLVDLQIQVATRELHRADGVYRGAHIYEAGKQNKILLRTVDESNADEHIYTFPHESDHTFWIAKNEAQCTSQDIERIGLRQNDAALSENEIISAPYNSSTKPDFIKAIKEGEQNIANLRKLKYSLINKPIISLFNQTLKKFIECLDNEAAQSPLVKSFHNEITPPLIQVLDEVDIEMKISDAHYLPDSQLFELSAAINGALCYCPKLFNFLFPTLRKWYLAEEEFKKCVEEIEPERLTLSC